MWLLRAVAAILRVFADPVEVVGDARVDAGVTHARAPVAPRHHAYYNSKMESGEIQSKELLK
jgi:hypothetical protein